MFWLRGLGEIFPWYVIMPKKHCSSFWSVGSGISVITFIFLASGAISLLDIVCLRNINWRWLYWDLARFSFNPDCRTACGTSIVLFSSSSGVSAQRMISSCAFRHPSVDFMIAGMRAWHTSLALWIPHRMRRNLKQPQGELEMRSLELSSSTLICQKASEASSLVKNCAPGIFWNILVAVGRRWCSLLIVLFRFRESKQTRRLPLLFSTATREETQSVGSLTGTSMSSWVIRCSSCFSLCLRANGTLSSRFMIGLIFGSIVMWWYPGNIPSSPPKILNFERKTGSSFEMLRTLFIRCTLALVLVWRLERRQCLLQLLGHHMFCFCVEFVLHIFLVVE